MNHRSFGGPLAACLLMFGSFFATGCGSSTIASPPPILVSAISIPTVATVGVGSVASLTATILPSNASTRTLTWRSSNSSVATVNSSGVVTGIATGTAQITASSTDGSAIVSNAANVTVVQWVSKITLPLTASVNAGSSTTVSATVLPSNATNPALAWNSSNTAVATVSQSGVITGVAPGTAQITAVAIDGSNIVSNATTVTVVQLVTNIALPATSSTTIGSLTTLSATVLPANASNPALAWNSSNTAVATVNSAGVVTGVALGTTQITAAATDGSGIVSNAAAVSVTLPPIPVTQIVLPTIAFVNAGTTTALTAMVLPGDASNPALTWHSSSPAVATVSSSGIVSGVSTGTAQITAVSTDGTNITSNICQLTTRPSAAANSMGINFGPALDYTTNRIFADVMKTSHAWSQVGQSGTVLTALDANGWPTQDASITVFQGINNMQGTYALSFNGQATLSSTSSTITNKTYNPSANLTTATLLYTSSNASSGLILTFTNTLRTPTSAANSGVTNVVLMRPVSVGASTAYTNQTFTTPFLSALSGFSVLRATDFTATASSTSINWSDRTLPGNASQQVGKSTAPAAGSWEGRGGAWEYAILLANQTGEDLWVNIPEQATDDYVTKLAQMIQYGSDGTNPYTAAQLSPLWPALAPGLKVYVEFSNELWNSANGTQSQENYAQAVAEVGAGGSPLNFDGSTSASYWAWRRVAERTVEISNDFRAVVGDTAMMDRVRPVLSSQLGNPQNPLYQAMHLMVDYYDNAGQVSSPQPPSHYIYGLGSSANYGPTDLSSVASILSTIGAASSSEPSFVTEVQEDADWSLAFGVHRIAYEGGPILTATGNTTEDANQASAWSDPGMEQVVVNEHNAWSQNGGDLLVYYELTWDYEWGFMTDVLAPSTEKMAAIAALNQTPRVVSTYGTAIPGILSAASPTIPPAWTSSNLAVMSNQSWMSFSVLVSTAGPYNLTLNAGAAATGAQLQVFVDGSSIGTATVPNTGSLTVFANSSTLSTPNLSVGSHGIMVRSVSGVAQLNKITVQ